MTTSSPDDLPMLGRYQVLNKIASGGMAEVFLAKAVGAMGFQRLVALKLISANFTRDPEFVKMFIDEARIAMHLHHRNIVQVFDLDQAGDTYFIAMEFVHGVNLYDLYERIASKNRWIEPSMALYLIAEISKGLHFAHTRRSPEGRPLGIVHRDISPQNVLLSFEGEVKITDFGIATAAERLHTTAAGIVKGKYAYMAPERLQDQPIDGRVDVFSTGVLLYELLVGENPFAGESAVDTIENVLKKRIVPPSERGAPVATGLDRITLKALARNPAERYQSAQEFADAVTEYALELTHARKDMAAGDAALALLLGELFPEKSKRVPGAVDPKSLDLPGVGTATPKVAAVDTSPEPRRPDIRDVDRDLTDESIPADMDLNTADTGLNEEPTLLRLAPLDDGAHEGAPKIVGPLDLDSPIAPEEATHSDSSAGYEPLPAFSRGGDTVEAPDRKWGGNMPTPITPIASNETDKTAPTELPMTPGVGHRAPSTSPRAAKTDPAGPPDMDDALAATHPSRDPPGIPSGSAAATPAGSFFGVPAERAPQPPRPQVGRGPQTPRPISGSPPDLTVTPSRTRPSSQGATEAPIVPIASGFDLPADDRAPRTSTPIIAALILVILALLILGGVLFLRNQPPERRASPVALKVTSSPPGAVITIDGKPQRGVTPYDAAVLAYEAHTIAVSLDGYAPVEPQTIRPLEGNPVMVHFDLAPIVRRGAFSVRTTPPDARVSINGREHGVGSVDVSDLPLDQPITVRVEANGYKPYEQTITLTTPDVLTIPIVLTKGRTSRPEPRTRKVTLVTDFQSWAVVRHNEQLLGTTPLTAILPIGPVKLRVVNEVIKLDKVITVTIPESGPDQIKLELK